MEEPIYIWQVLIHSKVEYKLYQACILVGIDIYDDLQVYFEDYERLPNGLHASVLVTCTDSKMTDLYHKMIELKTPNVYMYLVDELEEIEEENELWKNQ